MAVMDYVIFDNSSDENIPKADSELFYEVLNLSLAALGSLMWIRKNKPRKLIPIIYACAGILATMPSIYKLLEARNGIASSEGCGF